jgi:hypothetical protein
VDVVCNPAVRTCAAGPGGTTTLIVRHYAQATRFAAIGDNDIKVIEMGKIWTEVRAHGSC